MKFDINIGYDDLSDACKAKIEKIEKLVGKENIYINYPTVANVHSCWIDTIAPGQIDQKK